MTVLEFTKTLEEMKMDPFTSLQIRTNLLCNASPQTTYVAANVTLIEVPLQYAASAIDGRILASEVDGARLLDNGFVIYIPDPKIR